VNVGFVTARAPYPCDSGGRIRTFHLLREIAKRHDVTLMTAVETRQDVAVLGGLSAQIPAIRIRSVPVPRRDSPTRNLVRLARLPYDRRPYTWVAYSNAEFATELRRWLSEGRYDVVHCDHVQVAEMLLAGPTPPRLVTVHNVESLLIRRLADRYRGLRRAVIAWQARRVADAESRCLQRFDRAIAVSEFDAALLQRMLPGLSTSVVPNGVDTDMFAPRDRAEKPQSIVFTGAMDWLPNVDGVGWFVREVFPRIRQRLGNAVFTVVGRNPAASMVRQLSGEGVSFTGTVNDVRPFVHGASVVVVPLLVGSGTRLKILEAWAMAKAVVSTSIGAEGLPSGDGRVLLIADTAEDFATRVVQLLGDATLRRRLGAEGRIIVENRFAWRVVGETLLHAYEMTARAAGHSVATPRGRSRGAPPSPMPRRTPVR
jgi:sugar transferase (PEP-CTERM/EpsH1 system associated)